jgi:quercetin dioxygenase-like cupin family protein
MKFITQLQSEIEYPNSGVSSKILFKDSNCQHTLLCLAASTDISEHSSPRNALLNVIEGQGILILEGKEIPLEKGVFVLMPANAPHALKAEGNLAFLLTFSASSMS